MDDVSDLIERFAERGHPRGAQRVLDDARSGTVVLTRQSPLPTPRRRGRIAIAVLAGVAVVGAAFVAGRNNSSQDDDAAGRAWTTVLDNVSDADAARLCQAFAPLAMQADQSRQSLDPETTASVAEQYLELATQARLVGAVDFAAALTESGEQLALFAQQSFSLIQRDKPGTTMTQTEFRLGLLRLQRADTELELACTARGHDPLFAQLSDGGGTPTTTATR